MFIFFLKNFIGHKLIYDVFQVYSKRSLLYTYIIDGYSDCSFGFFVLSLSLESGKY